jgi:SAM-dependent methyltransferase
MDLIRRFLFSLAYLGRPPWDSRIVPPEVEEHIHLHPPGRALDLGCGSGTSSLALARAGWQVTGVDLVARAVRIARRRAQTAGLDVRFLTADVRRLPPLPGPFDLILDVGCFHSLARQQKAAYLEQLDRLLAPDGTWLLYAFLRSAQEAGPGVTETEIERARRAFRLRERRDGSERGRKPSAWFWFSRGSRRAARPTCDPERGGTYNTG